MPDTLLPIAATLIRNVDADTVPIYGSTDFDQLQPTDPRWIASVLRAAECWRLQFTADQVADRLDHDSRVTARRVRLASYDIASEPLPKYQPWPADAGVPAGFYGDDGGGADA